MEYHIAIHLTGSNSRNMTLLDLQNLESFFTKIHVKKYVICIEPATHDHLHSVFELKEKRPNIKRDILNSLKIESKNYPNNFCYCKRLKIGQTFNMLGGGYLTKGYKHLKTKGIDYIELQNGKTEYEQLKDRKIIKITRQNIIKHYLLEAKELGISTKRYKPIILINMLRNKKYNFCYVIGKITLSEMKFMIHFEMTEPDQGDDEEMLEDIFFKKDRYLFS